MEVTDYFRRNVLENPERPGITRRMCEEVVESPEYSERQPDGRFAFWGRSPGQRLYPRVIVTGDRRTIPNAFFDSNFTRKHRRKDEG